MEQEKDEIENIVDYSNIFEAFTLNYLNVYIIDPIKNKARILKLNGYITTGIKEATKIFDYTEILSNYIFNRVYKDDQKFLFDALLPTTLNNTFKNSDNHQIEISYRVIDNGEIHYCTAHYIQISKDDEPLKIVAGFRNVDSIVNEQYKNRHEGLYKAYRALSSIYLSMHRINVKNDTYHEIKSSQSIDDQIVPDSTDYSNNVKRIMTAIVNPTFLESVLRFVDIKTLDSRLKDHNYISLEFLGNVNGWCKATFIKEDEDDKGYLWHVLFTVEVIDEEKQRENILRNLAETDSLTGMLNRRCGTSRMEKHIKNHEAGIFCILDCDKFKSINDTFGHKAGDDVLVGIAKCFKNICRPCDITMRLGGDEFALFTPGITDKDRAVEIYKRFIKDVETIRISQDPNFVISLSAGACVFEKDSNMDFNKLYKKADEALYRSKEVKGSWIEID